MAKYRKLGRTSSQRKALLRNQVTALLNNGKIVTTEAKAKEIRKIAEGLIALAVKEKDNFEEVTVKAKVARKDKDGKRECCLKNLSFSAAFWAVYFHRHNYRPEAGAPHNVRILVSPAKCLHSVRHLHNCPVCSPASCVPQNKDASAVSVLPKHSYPHPASLSPIYSLHSCLWCSLLCYLMHVIKK